MAKFVHLHTHSHYSLLQALPKIPELVEAAAEADMPALALTDNGNLYGAIEFYKACKARGIKPIILKAEVTQNHDYCSQNTNNESDLWRPNKLSCHIRFGINRCFTDRVVSF